MPKTSEGFDVPFELNKEIEEEVLVPKITIKDGKPVTTFQKATQKTIYIDAPLKDYKCDFKDHNFIPVKHRLGNFQCTKCGYIKNAKPWDYKFVDGKLIERV